MSHSNVVALTHPTELHRRPLQLPDASASIQRAVIYWADLVDQETAGSVLMLVERAPLLTDLSLLYERHELGTRLRFSGAAVAPLHRIVAESLLSEPIWLKPIARYHILAVAGGSRELCSLMLPFGRYCVALFED